MGNAQVRPQAEVEAARKTIADVHDSLTPFRPPTAPSSDLEIERKAIRSAHPSFLYIQLALFILLVVLISYLALPASVAHGVSVLVLSVGIAAGFFLRK